MSYQWTSNRKPGLPAAANDIHPAWCACTACEQQRGIALRRDVGAILFGLVCGFVLIGWLLFGSAK